jgi:hypothetical protein
MRKTAKRCTIQAAHQVITEAIVHAGNQNVIVRTESAQKGVVDASKNATNVPVRAVATAAARPMK